jgi:hypothetical protein
LRYARFSPPFTDRDNSREDPIVPRVLTDEQAKTLAQRYYTAAGLPETIQIFRIQEFAGDRKMGIVMDYVPPHEDIPYDRFVAGSRIEVNQETGTPRNASRSSGSTSSTTATSMQRRAASWCSIYIQGFDVTVIARPD